MTWAVRKLMRGAMYVFSWFVIPYSYFVKWNIPKNKLPPITNKILKIAAVDLSRMIRNQEVTCEEVIQSYIDRCNEVNEHLNAIVENRFEESLAEARQIDLEIKSGVRTVEQMEKETPLLGIPITVKESIGVKGMSNQGGRKFKTKLVAAEDAPIVKNVKKHGAIILLVSNTPELCLCWETYNKVTGRTNNPYNLRSTPGGSSGGESSLLGSGASLLGLGSDVAGSCRLPAMFTGVWGHKPSPHVVSPLGHMPGSSDPNWGYFFTTAPMCRYAKDISLLLECMRDKDGPKVDLLQEVDLEKINFFFMDSDCSGLTQPLEKDIKDSLNAVAAHFKAKRIKLDLLKWSLDISITAMLSMEGIHSIFTVPSEPGKKPTTTGKELLKYITCRSDSIFPSVMFSLLQTITNDYIPKSRHEQLQRIATKLKQQFLDLLGSNGVFLYPSFPNSAHGHFEIYHKLVDTSYLMVFNTLGLPVTQVMTGFDRNNKPIGFQVIANPNQDHLTIAVAKEIERIYGGWIEPTSCVDSKVIDLEKTKPLMEIRNN